MTLIQRFVSALKLNIHFHLLVLDRVYVRSNEQRRPAPGVLISTHYWPTLGQSWKDVNKWASGARWTMRKGSPSPTHRID